MIAVLEREVMAEKGKSAAQIGTMACWYGGLGTFSNACIAKLVDGEWQSIWFSASSVVVALVASGIVWLFSRYGHSLEYVKYDAMLGREIAHITKAMSHNGISDEARKRWQNQLEAALEKRASAERDIANGTVDLNKLGG